MGFLIELNGILMSLFNEIMMLVRAQVSLNGWVEYL